MTLGPKAAAALDQSTPADTAPHTHSGTAGESAEGGGLTDGGNTHTHTHTHTHTIAPLMTSRDIDHTRAHSAAHTHRHCGRNSRGRALNRWGKHTHTHTHTHTHYSPPH